jgi:NADH:ubiquinone oxidoreductase subunit 2 (subunit N)
MTLVDGPFKALACASMSLGQLAALSPKNIKSLLPMST